MVKIEIIKTDEISNRNQVLALGCFSDNNKNKNKDLIANTIPDLKFILEQNEYNNLKFGSIKETIITSNNKVRRAIFIGLGDQKDFDLEKSRIVAGKLVLYCKEQSIEDIIVFPFEETEDIIGAMVEGINLALYSFEKYKNDEKETKLKKVFLAVTRIYKNYTNKINEVLTITNAVNFAREISNLPPNECNPEKMAQFAASLDKKRHNIKLTIMGRKKLESLGLNGILAVGSGSSSEPKLIILEYNGKRTSDSSISNESILIVGKAVTFDTGGISLKPGDRMDEMKFDKCGGCNVIGIMDAISALNLPVNVIGLIPAVENMPSQYAYRPGDIIKMYNKKTVEILNTDAEGRIILADALAYGIKSFKPNEILDMATLTGACIIALGANVAAIVGNNDMLIEKIKSASQKTSEKIWQLPLFEDYYEQIKSKNADIKNIGGRPGGTITAAAFLSHFVENTPWIHFDIAGTAWNQDGTIPKSYNPHGATGFGIRLIVEYLKEKSKR